MNLTINTKDKTITINQKVNIEELYNYIKDNIKNYQEYDFIKTQKINYVTLREPCNCYKYNPFN